MEQHIDINSDVGESFGPWSMGDDDAIFESVTSANIACGFHAGDPTGIRATCEAAVTRGVTVGAHPGYRDLAGFGRRFLDVARQQLTDEIVYQIGALQGIATASGTHIRYVKPHGALGNAIVHHADHAQAVVDAVLAVDPGLAILGMPNSEVLRRAEKAGVRAVPEAFADRTYQPDGTLTPRSAPGAVLHDLAAIERRVLQLAQTGSITAVDGTVVQLDAESICVHSDTPGSVSIAARVRQSLETHGVAVRSFA